MRFTAAVATLLAGTATAAVANVNVNAKVDAGKVDAKARVNVPLLAKDVGSAGTDDYAVPGPAKAVASQVPAVPAPAPKVNSEGYKGGKLLDLDIDVKADIALKGVAGFECPAGMTYCPWARSCSCPPGQNLDLNTKKCVGTPITGAWPEPKTDAFGSKGIELAAFCAISPFQIVKYDCEHEFCQATLNSITFVAPATITAEIDAHVHTAIDINANVSVDLHSTIAGLASLHVATAVEAAALFNTDAFGLATAKVDVDVKVVTSLLGSVQSILCVLGVGKCSAEVDCVSFCTKGCKNFIDVGISVEEHIGSQIKSLTGLCILPNVLLIVGKAQTIVTVAVDGLMCMIGSLIKTLLGTFNCHCR